jgi:hypothetical protein
MAVQHGLVDHRPELRGVGPGRRSPAAPSAPAPARPRSAPSPTRGTGRAYSGVWSRPSMSRGFPPLDDRRGLLRFGQVREPARNRAVGLAGDRGQMPVQPVAQAGEHLRDLGGHVLGRRARPRLRLHDHCPVEPQLAYKLILAHVPGGGPPAPQFLAQRRPRSLRGSRAFVIVPVPPCGAAHGYVPVCGEPGRHVDQRCPSLCDRQ